MAKHEHDFRDGLDVCVGNYGYYNEGELHDTWMRLPMDPDKIEPWLRSLEKPVTPTDLARSASAAAATSAVIAASANQTAPKL
ncbi:MAG: antirestriction protein ArdA [Eggerthella lenta]